jgi:hypothetical protein
MALVSLVTIFAECERSDFLAAPFCSISLVSKAFAPLFWRSLRSLSRRHATLPRPGDRFPPRSDPTDARYAGYGLVPVTEATNSAYETVENLWWTYHFWAWDLARFTRLRRLHIELVFMPVEMRARLVDALPLFTSLHTLSISNDVRFGSKWALNINGLHNLRVLDLSRCNSTDEFQLLMNNLQHPSLQILYPRHGDYDSGQFKSRLPSLKLIVQNSLSSEIIAIGNSYNGWDLDAYISHWKDWDTEVSISRSSTFSESCPDKRATPLQTACQLENRQAVLRLLTTNSYKHMDVNYIDPATNRSVLGYCCHYCWLDILEVLLLNRASTGLSNTINTIFADGHTALSLYDFHPQLVSLAFVYGCFAEHRKLASTLVLTYFLVLAPKFNPHHLPGTHLLRQMPRWMPTANYSNTMKG